MSDVVIPVPPGLDSPPVPAFVPDRLGVRRVCIDVNRSTNQYDTSLLLCPASETAWGPSDQPEITSPDLVSELAGSPDSAEKMAALMAVQRMASDLKTIASCLLILRG